MKLENKDASEKNRGVHMGPGDPKAENFLV